MNETEKTENEKSSCLLRSIREDLSSAESRSGNGDDEVHSGVDRANVKKADFTSSQVRVADVTGRERKAGALLLI